MTKPRTSTTDPLPRTDPLGPAANPCEADRGWFEAEIVALLPDLYGTALHLARNRADAEDLVAEALKTAWGRLATLSDRNRFRGWIFRILTNAFLSDRRRRSARPQTEPLPEEDESFSIFERLHQPFLLWWGNPEQEFLNKLLREDLERSIEALPDHFRVVVVLAEVQGFSYLEIAETLDIPIGTVRSRLARGRSLLQKALWEHAQEAGLVHRTAEAVPPSTRGAP
jgi:RNA polymerase sigma-70 factor, ECF subfamily